jgi:RNA polymerase sigma-70 factor (ECF subfamily)
MAAEPTAAEHAGESEADAAWPRGPERVLDEFSDRQVIDALQRLPEEIRLTLLLVDVEQLRHEDAADVLQVPVGTIKSRAHRGRAMLRAALLPLARELRLVSE